MTTQIYQTIRRKKSDFSLFLNRKQLKKINFIQNCSDIISEKLTFQEALLKLPNFLEIIEINSGIKKISIDNKFGRFLAMWHEDGKELIHYELKTHKNSY